MDKDPWPFIEEPDYADLRGQIHRKFPTAYREWPPTYPEWFVRHDQERSKRERKGQELHPIKVHPEDFIRFCREHNRKGIPDDIEPWARHEVSVRAERRRVLGAVG